MASREQQLRDFITESNRIDGLDYKRGRRATMGCSDFELVALEAFLEEPGLTLENVVKFVQTCEPGAALRDKLGMQSRIGSDKMPPGGPAIRDQLQSILSFANRGGDPSLVHHQYESLHPFDRCNGYSGRAIWQWQMLHNHHRLCDSFLIPWYFESLSRARR